MSLRRVSWITALWTSGYGFYRLYYALGGTFGMTGTPVSKAQWIRINAIAAIMLFGTAVLAVAMIRLWKLPRIRPGLLAVCWCIAVACVSHARIDIVQRIASIGGWLTIDYPFWRTIDRRALDLQVLFFNEPWFLIEGLLWIMVAWYGALRESRHRRWWVGSAIIATLVSTAIGLLSAFGVIGKVIVG